MVMQLSPPPPHPLSGAPRTRRAPPSRRRRRLLMEHVAPSIDGVSAALGLGRPTSSSSPPKPVKKVQFGEVEEKLFSFDGDLAGDVFYTREELRVMNNVRFDDASKLRKKMFGEKSQSIAQDDSILSRKSTAGSTNQLFSDIINDRDEWDANISLDGIEPFVFLELRDEMVKKRANVRKEIIDFVKANKSDPQGWRLASHSRFHTQWARNIAQEKARALHEVLLDESKHPSKKSEPEKLKEGQDLLDGSIPVRFRDSAPTPSPRRSWAGRRPQRRASICGPSAVSAPVSNLSQLSPSKEVGTPAPDDKAQLQQSTKTFSLSESDDDDDDGGGAPDPSPRSPLFCGLWTSWM